MLKFIDGPASGLILSCARAPVFLRVVHDPGYRAAVCKKDRTEWDALDQLTDVPQAGETIYVYVKAADNGTIHYDGRDKNGRRFGRWEQCADYRLYEKQPDDATARDNTRWQAWAQEQHAALKAKGGGE